LFAAGVLVSAALAALPSHAEVASGILREGDALGGGTVNSINNPSVNHAGGGPGALLVNEGTYGGYLQTAFESFNGFSDAGHAAYSPTVTEISSGLTGLDAVWVDTTSILAERQ